MSTPHNSAEKGEFAKTILMPGDPLRAKFVAENFLTGARLVNNVRGIGGYTGTYKECPVSVMASGMGMPSMGIYSYELFSFYDADNIIRIGSAGSIREDVRIRDLVLGIGACTNSNYASQYGLHGTSSPTASWSLLSAAVAAAEKLGARYHVGNLLSTDVFYCDSSENEAWAAMGVLGAEMEAAALYLNAIAAGKKALGIMTVSDLPLTGESLSADERQNSFTQMMEIALTVAAQQA